MDVRSELVGVGDLPTGTVFADQDGGLGVIDTATPCVAIGPAGGWAPDEIPADAARCTFSPTVLRVETAAVAGAVEVRRISPFTQPL